jgi:hypothetical protein
MRRLSKATMAVVLVAATFLWGPSPARACSVTGPPPTEAQYVAAAEVVFEGTAVASRDPGGTGLQFFVVWTFSVDTPIKGPVLLQQDVVTALSGASCGYPFTVGMRYRVYARQIDGVLTTGGPDGTRLAPLVAPTTTVTTAPPVARPPTTSPARRIALTG